jgi:hypothetical protein
MLQRNSLENLVAISGHPLFGPAVMHLTIRLYHWTSSPQRANTSGRPQEVGIEEAAVEEEDVEEAGVDMLAYYRLMEDQLFMMESGLTITYLAQSLAALPALKTVSVDEQFTPWGVADLMRQTGLRLNDTLEGPDSIRFARHAIRAIVLAIIVSNTSLNKLDLSPGLEYGHTISLDMLAFSPSVLQLVQTHPVHVTTLSLAVSPRDRLCRSIDVVVSHFLRFVALFPGLEGLSLEFDPADDRCFFPPFSQRLRLQGLRFLNLTRVECTAGELLGLLRAHKGSLKHVGLSLVDVVAGDGEGWRAVLTAIRDEALIQTLEMDVCSEEGQDVGYREPGSEGLVDCDFLQVNDSVLPGSPDWTTMINGLVIGNGHDEDQESG